MSGKVLTSTFLVFGVLLTYWEREKVFTSIFCGFFVLFFFSFYCHVGKGSYFNISCFWRFTDMMEKILT